MLSELLKIMESNPIMPNTLRSKLHSVLSLLTKYTNNKKEINNTVSKLLSSSYVNISEAQQLLKQSSTLKSRTQ